MKPIVKAMRSFLREVTGKPNAAVTDENVLKKIRSAKLVSRSQFEALKKAMNEPATDGHTISQLTAMLGQLAEQHLEPVGQGGVT